MLARLGHTVYWAACAVALLRAPMAVYLAIDGTGDRYLGMLIAAGIGALTWLACRAVRYVLAGEWPKALSSLSPIIPRIPDSPRARNSTGRPAYFSISNILLLQYQLSV